MLLSGQVAHASNSSHLFWNLVDVVTAETLSLRRKANYHPLLIDFSHELFSIQYVRHMLHLNVTQQLP